MYVHELTLAESKRILSLRQPEQKMSKSAPDANSRILLTDSPAEIAAKIKKAVTDSHTELSYDPVNRPAVSNLLQMLAALDGGPLRNAVPRPDGPEQLREPAFVAELLNKLSGGSGAALKRALVEAIVEEFRPIQTEYRRLIAEDGYLDRIETLGRDKAQARARETLQRVRSLLGLQ